MDEEFSLATRLSNHAATACCALLSSSISFPPTAKCSLKPLIPESVIFGHNIIGSIDYGR